MWSIMVIVHCILCAILCGVVAGSKNRSEANWAGVGLLTGVLGLIAIAGIPALARKSESQREQLLDEQLLSRIYTTSCLMLLQQDEKIERGTCPVCNRRVVLGLPICPFCKQDLDWSEWVVAGQKENATQEEAVV